MIFIKDLKNNDELTEIYLVKAMNKSVTSTNKTFLNVTFQDKTGIIFAKKWDVDAEDMEIYKPGNFVNVRFEVTTFKDKLELKILDGNKVNVVKYDDYIPTSPIPKDVLQTKIESYINKITDKNIKLIVDEIYATYKDKYLTYPAASNNHHAFASGLAYHTVSMLEVADFLSNHPQYKEGLDKDIVIAGVLFHDLGKVKELSGLLPIEYTMEGRMLGHLVIAVNIINNVASKHNLENNKKIIMLEHAILASHGKYEFGSPVLGSTKEAILLNFIDDLDAKMMMYDNNVKDINSGEFSKTLMNFDMRRLYKKEE